MRSLTIMYLHYGPARRRKQDEHNHTQVTTWLGESIYGFHRTRTVCDTQAGTYIVGFERAIQSWTTRQIFDDEVLQ